MVRKKTFPKVIRHNFIPFRVKSSLLLFWILILIFPIHYSYSETDIPGEIENQKTILIASEPDYPPYCLIDNNGQAAGFSVELFKAAAAAVGLKVNINIGLWNVIKQDLAEGRIDALPLVGRTPEREPLYDFTFPYLSLHGAVFVRKGNTDINSLADLKDKEVAVMRGDNAEEFLRRTKLSENIITTHTFQEAFNNLASGKSDAVVTQRVMGLQLLKEIGLKSIVPLSLQLPDFRQDFCFAVKKGNTDLLNRLNEGLSIVIANGTYDEIHLKWFGPSPWTSLSVTEILLRILPFLIPALLILSSLIIIYLRLEIIKRTAGLRKEISEHQKTDLELKKNQLLFKEMEKVTKIGGWELDLENHNTIWTDGVYAIHDLKREDFNPSSPSNNLGFYPPEDQKILDEALKNACENGEPYDLELKFISAAGVHKWVKTVAQPVMINGKVIRIFGNIMDITKQRETEIELRKLKNDLEKKVLDRTAELEEKVAKLAKSQQAMLYMVEDLNRISGELKNERRELEATNRELEAFSYSVSHDLRAPLRAIDGFSRFLKESYQEKLDDTGQHYLDRIRAGSQRMGQFIDDLLSLSRSTRKEMFWQNVNLSQIADEIISEFRSNEPDRDVEVTIEKNLLVYGDQSLLRAVMENLLANAWKFTKNIESPKIHFGV
ncbi:MAG: transporter substrate-binding domain-containing protein, partial [Candidatus Cloacimonetes bacterium]|nr:transporter substrate-binding domain-containing protein [Candidatus Cloacimonadota bacterium]